MPNFYENYNKKALLIDWGSGVAQSMGCDDM